MFYITSLLGHTFENLLLLVLEHFRQTGLHVQLLCHKKRYTALLGCVFSSLGVELPVEPVLQIVQAGH